VIDEGIGILGKKATQGRNVTILKKHNQFLMLSIIKEHGPISRVAIAKEIGLTKSAISKVVNNLIKLGLVEEGRKDDTSVGRKPVTLKLTIDNYFVVGVGIRRTETSVGIANLQGDIIRRKKASLKKEDTQAVILKKIINLIYSTAKDSRVEMEKVIGIGVGSPGPLYAHSGVILSPPNFPGWHNVPLKELIWEEFDIPVFIDNDANVAALGEKWFGNAQGIDNFIYITLDLGIGAGIVINGEVYRGVDGVAGEFGHISISLNGKKCQCGSYGCLENLASSLAIIPKVKNLISSGKETILSKMVKGSLEDIEIEMILEAARKKDELSLEVLREAARYLGIGVANLVNLFNTKTIILGGPLAQAEEVFLKFVRKIVIKRVYPVAANGLKIIAGRFGEEIYVIGAAALALSNVFRELDVIEQKRKIMRDDSYLKQGGTET
jgi:glucokinase-like ROK family protein